MRSKVIIAGLVMLSGLAFTRPADASTISFSTSGQFVGGFPVSATADFNFFASSFTLTLTNTINAPGKIPQMLDGLLFTLSPAGTPSLTGASAASIIDCSGDTYPCPAYAGSVATNYGYTAPTAGGVTALKAGAGSFKPYGIINNTYTTVENGGLGNNPHNPLLIGPVTFTFSGAFTNVSNVSFLWGTLGEPTTGVCTTGCGGGGGGGATPPVPEPASMLLLGTGLLGMGAIRRRFGKTKN